MLQHKRAVESRPVCREKKTSRGKNLSRVVGRLPASKEKKIRRNPGRLWLGHVLILSETKGMHRCTDSFQRREYLKKLNDERKGQDRKKRRRPGSRRPKAPAFRKAATVGEGERGALPISLPKKRKENGGGEKTSDTLEK